PAAATGSVAIPVGSGRRVPIPASASATAAPLAAAGRRFPALAIFALIALLLPRALGSYDRECDAPKDRYDSRRHAAEPEQEAPVLVALLAGLLYVLIHLPADLHPLLRRKAAPGQFLFKDSDCLLDD